jgi:hypothetical protein
MTRDDRIRDLFYDAIESFPAEFRDTAERWLLECEVARIFFRAVEAEGLSAPRQLPRRIN